MTQAYNLSQLANNLTSTGLLDAADGLVNAVPIANGGTGATTASAARTNLGAAEVAFAIPSGGIIMWSGSIAAIPVGWFICNGANGTPNLTNRFIVAAGGTYAVGASGGTADAVVVSHTHTGSTGNQSANHSHGFTTDFAGDHQHEYAVISSAGGTSYSGGSQALVSSQTGVAGNHQHGGGTGGVSADHTHLITLNSAGVSGVGQNIPPYYALAYIMKA
jgi:hypothetical protein